MEASYGPCRGYGSDAYRLRQELSGRFPSNGIEVAAELSGHKSERYIWRYIQASEDEIEEALTNLWD